MPNSGGAIYHRLEFYSPAKWRLRDPPTSDNAKSNGEVVTTAAINSVSCEMERLQSDRAAPFDRFIDSRAAIARVERQLGGQILAESLAFAGIEKSQNSIRVDTERSIWAIFGRVAFPRRATSSERGKLDERSRDTRIASGDHPRDSAA